MVVHLCRTSPNKHSEEVYNKWLDIVQKDEIRLHKVTEHPKEADITIIVDVASHSDPTSWKLRTHPIWRSGVKNILAYDERDWPRFPLAGLVVSLPIHLHQPVIHRAAPYFRTIQYFEDILKGEPDLLFSFVGATSHIMREEIFKISHPRAVIARSGVNYFDHAPTPEVIVKQSEQKNMYRNLMHRSKFVLCPRGEGLSSFRMYEVMAAGRVPVVIADGWLPPSGPKWDEFLITIPESRINDIPSILTEYEPRFEEMSYAARQAFTNTYSREQIFNHLVNLCTELLPVTQNSLRYRFPPRLIATAFRHFRCLRVF